MHPLLVHMLPLLVIFLTDIYICSASYDTDSNYQLNVLISDTELIDPEDPLIINFHLLIHF